jgi:hypothetical protein
VKTGIAQFVPDVHQMTRHLSFNGIGSNNGPRAPWVEVFVQC